jgi:GTPase SAR1 family protein
MRVFSPSPAGKLGGTLGATNRTAACVVKKSSKNNGTPIFDEAELRGESDVEQKLLIPFLTNMSFVGLPMALIRTKEYMTPTDIDKAAGKRYGYIPDYSIWLAGLPLVVIEAKAPDITVQSGLRDAHLYASQINKRYPPGVNPIGFVLASNGIEFALAEADSEVNALIFPVGEAVPGSAVLQAIKDAIGKDALDKRAKALAAHFQSRGFFAVSNYMGGQSLVNRQLGVNEFAQPLFPALTKYFANNSDDTPDEVIDRAYVTSDELGGYEGILETYLKDRGANLAGNQLQPIVTSRNTATGISTEVSKFAANPAFYSRVQLIIGAVGAGKSTFVRRYYRRLMSKEVSERTCWAFLNFNVLPPDKDLHQWISERFIQSFSETNSVDVFDHKNLQKIFGVEINRFENGANKPLKNKDPAEYARRLSTHVEDLSKDAPKFAACIARHFSGEKGQGIVVLFDNVDKRSREQQLKIFEAAQWFKDITKSLVLVNLRDSTFEAHRDEPPLDAFINAINFYVRPPRFAQVIRKRMELLLETLSDEVAPIQEYSLPSGFKISYPASRLGEYLLGIYLSMFDRGTMQVGQALESLVAKDVRRALGMFGDIIVSPHIPTDQIAGITMTAGKNRIQENRIIRSLMRGRYKYFNGRSLYVQNILAADPEHERPSNFLNADILEYLIRRRKEKIDLQQEGYARIDTLIKAMGVLGYGEADTFSAVRKLVLWGLIEPESLVVETLGESDVVRVQASGFMHMRFFMNRNEYLVGITPNMNFSSKEVAEEIGTLWATQDSQPDISLSSKKKILEKLKNYLAFEHRRRVGRHAFYEEAGWGGKAVVTSVESTLQHFNTIPAGGVGAAKPRNRSLPGFER